MGLEQMQQLLKEAVEMQRGLEELRSSQLSQSPSAQAGELDGDEDAKNVLARLRSLEAEKRQFEEELRSSQEEHETLLGRLTEMRTLMSALGVNTELDSEAEIGDEQE